MDGKVDLITLVALVIAVIVIVRLRSVLGRRTGDESARYEKYKEQEAARETARANEAAAADKVVTLPRRDRPAGAAAATAVVEPDVNQEQRMTKFAGGNPAVAKGLIDIVRADPSFDPDGFMKGGRAAYEMIVMAFAEGNRKVLKDLLSPDVYAGFDAAITERELIASRPTACNAPLIDAATIRTPCARLRPCHLHYQKNDGRSAAACC